MNPPNFFAALLVVLLTLQNCVSGTFFYYTLQTTCRRADQSQIWCYSANFYEEDSWSADDYAGSLERVCTTEEYTTRTWDGIMFNDGPFDTTFEPYVEIYHNCYTDEAEKQIRVYLPRASSYDYWHNKTIPVDLTMAEKNVNQMNL